MKTFSSMHPATCFCYYLGVLVLSMILFHPLFLGTALLVLILLNYCQDKGEHLRDLLPYYLFLSLLIVLFNPLLNRRGATILFYLLDRQVTL
ncbi:MAG TPA: energy-coupling factor transporter transmembrane protein EcfT, partial [Clostridia bacterium]|nr:energy-coupling factor transporter transmembrane protein EcfT [Clostridia bacterium]